MTKKYAIVENGRITQTGAKLVRLARMAKSLNCDVARWSQIRLRWVIL
jgi:hypothetical protein